MRVEFEDHPLDVRAGSRHLQHNTAVQNTSAWYQRHLVVGVEVLDLAGLEDLQLQLLLLSPGGLVDECLVLQCLANCNLDSKCYCTLVTKNDDKIRQQ